MLKRRPSPVNTPCNSVAPNVPVFTPSNNAMNTPANTPCNSVAPNIPVFTPSNNAMSVAMSTPAACAIPSNNSVAMAVDRPSDCSTGTVNTHMSYNTQQMLDTLENDMVGMAAQAQQDIANLDNVTISQQMVDSACGKPQPMVDVSCLANPDSDNMSCMTQQSAYQAPGTQAYVDVPNSLRDNELYLFREQKRQTVPIDCSEPNIPVYDRPIGPQPASCDSVTGLSI